MLRGRFRLADLVCYRCSYSNPCLKIIHFLKIINNRCLQKQPIALSLCVEFTMLYFFISRTIHDISIIEKTKYI